MITFVPFFDGKPHYRGYRDIPTAQREATEGRGVPTDWRHIGIYRKVEGIPSAELMTDLTPGEGVWRDVR